MSDTSFSDFILDLTYINSIILSESIPSKSLTITKTASWTNKALTMSGTSFSDFILDLTYINSIILSESISSKSLTITQKMLCHCIVHHKIIQTLQSKLDLSQLIS